MKIKIGMKSPLWEQEGAAGGGSVVSDGGDPPPSDPPADDPPKEPSVVGEQPPADPKPEPDPAPEPFTEEGLASLLPEGLELEDAQRSELVEAINSAEDKQALAGKLMEMYHSAQTSAAEAAVAQWNDTQEAWRNEIKQDPEFAGEKLGVAAAKANEIAREYGGEDFLKMLDLTGAGNHVSTLRFLNAIAKDLPSEGSPVAGQPGQTQPDLADRLFKPQ